MADERLMNEPVLITRIAFPESNAVIMHMNYIVIAINPIEPAVYGPQVSVAVSIDLRSTLAPGDTIKITANNTSWMSALAVGDVIEITRVGP
jgi:hypothetical protein